MPQGAKQWRPFCEFRENRKFETWEKLELCTDYLSEKAEEQCKCMRKRTRLSYHCLSILEGNSDLQQTIASCMLQFFDKKREEQYTMIMDWLYFLPFINNPSKNAAPLPSSLNKQKVRRSEIAVILDWGIGRWDTCTKYVKANTSPIHKLKGCHPNNVKNFGSALIKEAIHNFLEHIKNLAQPAATQIVHHEVAGAGLRKSKLDVFDLPSLFTKISMYYRYALERGWKVDIDMVAKLIVEPIKDFDGERKEICSWAYLVSYWQQNFPKLRVSNPNADVCSKCHVFRNQLRYIRFETSTEPGSSTTFAEHSIDAFYNNTKGSSFCTEIPKHAAVVLAHSDQFYMDVYLPALLLEKETLHVNQAADQRKLANEMMQRPYNDAKNGVAHGDRTYTFVVDYCQNANLPNLGATQSGETYYMIPLTVPILCHVDCSVTGGRLDAYIYHKGVGGKSGDNVASLIRMNLRQKGYMKDTSCGGELNIVMDNCQGQNNNNMVICLVLLLMEARNVKKVSFVFYIGGHTKNIADRWFNTMKKNY
eukprot:jgi/Psemu1/21209/gm1.21209_g